MSRKAKLTAQLPSTPCTPEMREKVVKISDELGISIAEIQRDAISLFLSKLGSKRTINDSNAHKRQGVQS